MNARGQHDQSQTSRVFVFGSNAAGRHGKGAALDARIHHGAVYGQGVGYQGNSYAIPTKDARLHVLPLSEIAAHVAQFLAFARAHPDLEFNVTRVGCGLAGYSPEDIGPMFTAAPGNCHLPPEFINAITARSPRGQDALGTASPSAPQRRNYFKTR